MEVNSPSSTKAKVGGFSSETPSANGTYYESHYNTPHKQVKC